MKLNYFELLSPYPIFIENTCHVLSPKLKDISAIGYNTYQFYILILLLDSKSYFDFIGCTEQYEKMSDDEIIKLDIFNLMTSNKATSVALESALNFFLQEKVTYSQEDNCYYTYKKSDDKRIGMISKDNYADIRDIICQRNNFKGKEHTDLSNIKSKKALEIMKKLQKGRSKNNKLTNQNNDMELDNIISAVANKSQSLNILNIWDLTVFQLWDCFFRLSNNNIYDIQSMSVAAWGDKDKHFNAPAWFKRINTEL